MTRKGRSGPADTVFVDSVQVVIVDDDDDMRSLLRLMFDLEAAVEVVGEAATCAGAVAVWREHRPDVVVLDYRMPDCSGTDAAREILAEDPKATIIMFSASMNDQEIAEAKALGVRAFVSKDQLRALTDFVIAFGQVD
jgi:DNA-binding NarL/FixJ family response regulator